MRKLLNAVGVLLAQCGLPPDEQDQAAKEAAYTEYKAFLADAANLDGLDAATIKSLRQEAAEARKLLDAQADELRQMKRIRAATPIVLPPPPGGFGRPRMCFSTPALAREFWEFARDVKQRGMGEKAGDLSPASDAAGGYTIPETLSPEIMRFVETVGVARRVAGMFALPAGTWKKARRLAGATMHWKSPGATVASSSPEFGIMEMSAETLMGLLDVDIEFEEDTAIDVANFLATEFGYSIADEEDRVAFAGTGIGTDGGITGLMNSTYVTDVTMGAGDTSFADLDSMDYLTDCESAVWDGALASPACGFLMHRTIKALVKKIKDSAGLPIWQPASAGEPSEIIGYPHESSGHMPALADDAADTPFLAFGDFRRGLLFGRRGSIRMDYSPWPGFKTGQNCFRAMERLDMAVQGYTSAEIAANSELGNPLARLRTHA